MVALADLVTAAGQSAALITAVALAWAGVCRLEARAAARQRLNGYKARAARRWT